MPKMPTTCPGFAVNEISVSTGWSGAITKRHFFKRDTPREPAWLDGVGPALHFDRRVQHFKHAPRRREALLHGIGDGRDVRHLSGELLEQAREHHQPAAQRNFPCTYSQPP
jgi:hypothetical protein